MEQKEYPLKTALSIACDIFNTQGYVKDINPGKDVDTNKSVLAKRLDKEVNFVHPDIENIIDYSKELVFKKMEGKMSDFEELVVKCLGKKSVLQREIGIVASIPLMYSNAMKKREKQKRYDSFQQTSKFQGVLGEKHYAPVVLLDKFYHNRGFWIYTFVQDNKHILKWLTGKEYEEFNKGAKIKLSGVVKTHNVTAYYGDETTLRSCKLIRDFENA